MKSLSEIAVGLGMSDSGLRKLVAKSEIQYFQHRKHGRIMFEPEWVDEYKSKHTHAPIDGAIPVSTPRKKRTTRTKIPETSNHGFNWDLCV
jgi:hypothetical protein